MEKIKQQLESTFSPSELTIIDDSAKHIGHAGNIPGRGHFIIKIRAAAFQEKTLLERHRMIYAALEQFFPQEIHALSIDAKPSND